MIPPRLLLPQDMVLVRDRGPRSDELGFDAWRKINPAPVVSRWHASDAKHAMTVAPERYELVDPESEHE